MTHVMDTDNNAVPHITALKAAGYDTVGRYIAAGLEGNEKVIKPDEAAHLAAAGIKVFLIYEINGRPRGAAEGGRDGSYARSYAPKVGAPRGSIIWYTDDEDGTAAEYPAILAAFQAFRAALSGDYRCGAYASGYICDRLTADHAIDARWITESTGFQGSRESVAAGRFEMRQIFTPNPIAGLDADLNAVREVDGKEVDIGAFIPADLPAPAPVRDIAWVQHALNDLKFATPPLAEDGVEGPITKAAIRAYQGSHGLSADGIAGPLTIAALEKDSTHAA